MLIEHARKLDAHGEIDDFWMLVSGETIVATGTGRGPRASTTVDASGSWLTPGFIDLHCHGGGGHSFDDGIESITAGLRFHRAHGTTRSLVSLVANPLDDILKSLRVIADMASRDSLLLGSHMEGPFLSPQRSGAHNTAHLRNPIPTELEQILAASRGTLRQITLAPELPDAFLAIDLLTAAGVVVSLGHTESTDLLARTAFDRGARMLTHAFNAMPGIHHRAPGPIVAAFSDNRVVIELILDGHHVDPSVAALLFAATPGRIAIVTDAMAGAGLPDGDFTLGTLEVTVSGGVARLRGTETIAGSTVTQDVALRIAIEELHIPPSAAVEALTLTPARALGMEWHRGLLAPGFSSDAVRLSPDWGVLDVWANGLHISSI